MAAAPDQELIGDIPLANIPTMYAAIREFKL